MITIIQIAEKVAERLGEYNAEVSMTPDFELKKMSERRIVVVPSERKIKIVSRSSKQVTYTIDVGIVCRSKKENDSEYLMQLSERIGDSFLAVSLEDMMCISTSWEPLYSPESLRTGAFISVVRLQFTGFSK